MMNEKRKQGGCGALIKIAYRNIWRNKRRTIFCVAAMVLAVFFTIMMQSMIAGMFSGMEKVVQAFDAGHLYAVSADFEAEKEYVPVQYPVANGETVAKLQQEITAIPGVKAVVPRINAIATLQDSAIKHAILWGIDIEAETALHPMNLTDRNNGLVEGRFPEPGASECAIGTRMAKKAGLRVGDRIPLKTVSAQFSDKMWSPEITGIFEFDYRKYDEDVIIVDFGRFQRLLVLGDATQQIFVFAENAAMSKIITPQVEALLGESNVVHDWEDNYFVATWRQGMAMFVIVELVVLIVASFLIVNTVVMIIHERIKEIGMMGSLGMTRWEIVEVFFFESLFLSILGALAGVLLGGIATFIGSLSPLGFTGMSSGSEFPTTGAMFLVFSPGILWGGFFYGVIISSLCTLIPSLRSAFVEPVEALRQ
jgi:putative ABC transport system permease protein